MREIKLNRNAEIMCSLGEYCQKTGNKFGTVSGYFKLCKKHNIAQPKEIGLYRDDRKARWGKLYDFNELDSFVIAVRAVVELKPKKPKGGFNWLLASKFIRGEYLPDFKLCEVEQKKDTARLMKAKSRRVRIKF